jgi:hypothetical protein
VGQRAAALPRPVVEIVTVGDDSGKIDGSLAPSDTGLCTPRDTELRKRASLDPGTALAAIKAEHRMERAMERTAYRLEDIDEVDELTNDRIPGLPLLGFFTGTVLSLAIWLAVAVVALSV